MVKALLIKGAKGSLQYQDNDIQMLSDAFKSIQIEVEYIDGDKHVVIKKLDDIIDGLKSTDTLIVYYTGHGVIKNGEISFKLDVGEKMGNYLSVRELTSNTSYAIADNVVLILDCCYATAVERTWNDYVLDKHILFTPSSKLEAVEEREEYQASFFTYCICEALKSKSDSLYEDNKITLKRLYEVTKANAQKYNKELATTMPIPELFGKISKEVVLGYRDESDMPDKNEDVINEYLTDFTFCVEKCERACNEDHYWCSSIFKSDANIYKYVIPSVKEFILKHFNNLAKLDAFFEVWFTKQDNYLGILGDMGVGKTTACLYLFYYLAKRYNCTDFPFVPVYIPLNNYSEWLKKGLDIFADIAQYMGKRFDTSLVRSLCISRKMVFILDGFDEISGDSSISAILHNYESLKPIMRFQCKTILTCRTHYFSEQDQIEEVLMGKAQGTDFAAKLLNDEYPFNIVELQEFSEEEILDLIKILLPERDSITVWKEIGDIYDLQDLAKRAILLKMIVQTLPELQKSEKENKVNSTTLYSMYTQKLLRREIENRKIGIELSEKERFIGYIANLMYVNDKLTIATSKFDKEIKCYFMNSLYSRDQLNNYNYDCKVSTFFSRDAQDNYKFIHKSFYEYYFALHCVRQIGEDDLSSWDKRWFPREIAHFIAELLESKKYKHLISKVIQTSLETYDEIVIWNTLHVLSLLDEKTMERYLTDHMRQEYIERGNSDTRSVIIRQYCRILGKFIDRLQAETLIEKIIRIVKINPKEDEYNDQTYYNYYGGKNAACQAFIKHLSVNEPKYDAKLHLYMLGHLASSEYADIIVKISNGWVDREKYVEDINSAVNNIRRKNVS